MEANPKKKQMQEVTPPEDLGIVSSIPYTGAHGDTLVIYCADPRFRKQTHELLNDHLQVVDPAVLTLPGGVAPLLPLVGIAHKLVKTWVDMLFKKLALKRIICVAHEDCAAYQTEGKHQVLLNFLFRATGASTQELQHRHLRDAKLTLQTWFSGVAVEVYFASLNAGEDGTRQVVFTKIA